MNIRRERQWHGRDALFIGVLCAVAFLIPSSADAARLFAAPATATVRTGDSFPVILRVDTQGVSINTVEAQLRFDPSQMTVESLSSATSIFDLNVQQPEFSNTEGTIRMAGVILNPGYIGASGEVVTIVFRARAPGQAPLTFSSGTVLANDGRGTNVLTDMRGSTYTVAEVPSVAPPEPSPGAGPIVLSATHPNPERWYADNDPRFAWIVPQGVSGVSWLIHENPLGNPGSVLDGLVDQVSFEDLPDGLHYFHIKFQRDGVFGPITHYPFRIDTVPPHPFTPVRVSADDLTDPRPELVYTTADDTSGVQQYRMRIDDGDWTDVPEAPSGEPYRLPSLSPGAYTVTVEAIDAAGLAARAQVDVLVDSIRIPVIDEYTAQLNRREPLRVAGTAAPHHTVTVSAWHSDSGESDTAAESSATVDASGRWQVTLTGLDVGTYDVRAVASDVRGAVSTPSDTVTVYVGSWLARQFSALSRWYDALPVWMPLLLIVVLALLVFASLRRRRKARRSSTSARGRKDMSELEKVLEDIAVEIATIDRLAKRRSLYPEERYLRTKLTHYQKALTKVVRAGVTRTKKKRARAPKK